MRLGSKLVAAVFLIIIVLLCSVTISAHSGGTDADGGHIDHSTGEYHWHHGYPAHQHEDRDGDGYPEYCPYRNQNNYDNSDFDCGRDNCNIAGPHGHINKDKTEKETVETTAKTEDSNSDPEDTSDDKQDVSWKNIVGIVFAALIFSPFILSAVFFVWHRIVAPIVEMIRKMR